MGFRHSDRAHRAAIRRGARGPTPLLPAHLHNHPAVLVIDVVGYLGYGPEAANALFQVVNVPGRRVGREGAGPVEEQIHVPTPSPVNL